VLSALRQGVTPEKIALSIAFGIVLGTFPVLGTSTFLCIAVTLLFRLNPAAIQVVNYLVYPLQIILIIPLIRLGEWLFARKPLSISLGQITQLFQEDMIGAMTALSTALMHAIVGWLLVGSLAVVVLYLLLTPLMRRLSSTSRMRSSVAMGDGDPNG
jgi:hypothetical protein